MSTTEAHSAIAFPGVVAEAERITLEVEGLKARDPFGADGSAWDVAHDAALLLARRIAVGDSHGNLTATEGCSRCDCGVKYWEMDRCVDCGTVHNRARHDAGFYP